jgi:hypothetical protein
VKRIVFALIVVVSAIAAWSQTTYQQQQPGTAVMARPAPALSVTLNPNPCKGCASITFSGSVVNPPLYYNFTPTYRYGYMVTQGTTQRFFRDMSTSASATWSAPPVGTYHMKAICDISKPEGGHNRYTAEFDFEIKPQDKLTWNTPMTDAVLGFAASANIKDKKLSEIVNSSKSGRSDGRKCNECHFSGASKMYRPTTSATINPDTSISRGNPQSSGETYKWNQTGTSGVVHRFCTCTTAPDCPKPTELCNAFKKWLNDGALTQ